jgi:DNA-binding MarR family transcriptional regulator
VDKKLRGEIQRSRPFTSGAEEAFWNLQRTSAVLTREFEAALKPFGLTHTQYNVLRILRGAGSEGLLCRQLGERMVTPDPDITRLVDRLERRGLIFRLRDHRGRRAVSTHITDDGRRLLGRLDVPVAEFHRKRLAHFDRGDLRRPIRLLESARARG